jgi:hypothetical protein
MIIWHYTLIANYHYMRYYTIIGLIYYIIKNMKLHWYYSTFSFL